MPIQGFRDWLATPQGQYVLEWERDRHDQLVADIFGFNAVQIGLPEVDFLCANRMPFRFRLGSEGPEEVIADLHHLPIASSSVDLVVLPHALEFDDHPHQILREVERILVPEGQVLVTGFNPYSLWGAKRRLSLRRNGNTQAPFAGRYISVPRLRDWFALLGLETGDGSFGCYAPAMSQEKWLRRLSFMEPAGDRWWPFAGAVYVMQGIKRHHGMRLITPTKWSERLARAKALATATPSLTPRIDNE